MRGSCWSFLTLGPAVQEESAEDAGAAFSERAAKNGAAVVEAVVAGDAIEGVASACLQVCAAVHNEWQARLHDGAGAHGARLEGDVKRTIFQTPGTQRGRRLCDGDHLRV